jgi:cystathionine beta-lyase/cystathionine gamma-synthase
VMANFGLEFTYVNTSDLKAVERAIRRNTKYLWVETPTNPLMTISDIAALSEIAHKRGVEVVVDNTFMSPYLQQPIKLGADMVMHSTTKFLNGHSDGLGGVMVCTKKEQAEKLAFLQKASGGIMSPFECWLVLRGVKTLAVRMTQHDENGQIIADYLHGHKKVKSVAYPGLSSHPQHDLAKRQMKGFGSMINFETGSLNNAKKMLKRVKVCTLGESLGGVETLISHPATMTHAAIGVEGRKKIGLTDGMVRISVGIEDVEDLIQDLEQALAGI